MKNYNPITTRAKCNYSNLPANQEVTVDAKGKTPVKLGYKTPLKQTKQTKHSHKVEYKNIDLMNSVRSQDADGIRQAHPAKPTAKDSADYRSGFEFGVKNFKNPPKNGYTWESSMFKGGRWEGQNKAKKESSPNKKKYCNK